MKRTGSCSSAVEQPIRNRQVRGSNPRGSSNTGDDLFREVIREIGDSLGPMAFVTSPAAALRALTDAGPDILNTCGRRVEARAFVTIEMA